MTEPIHDGDVAWCIGLLRIGGASSEIQQEAADLLSDLLAERDDLPSPVYGRVEITEHGLSAVFPTPSPTPDRCSGVAASWCPVHGDCTCEHPEAAQDDFACPLHSPKSDHAAVPAPTPDDTAALVARLREHYDWIYNCDDPDDPVRRDIGAAADALEARDELLRQANDELVDMAREVEALTAERDALEVDLDHAIAYHEQQRDALLAGIRKAINLLDGDKDERTPFWFLADDLRALLPEEGTPDGN